MKNYTHRIISENNPETTQYNAREKREESRSNKQIIREKDNLAIPLSSGFQPQNHHLLKHQNSLRKSGQQLCETVLSKIVNLSKNGNIQDLQQYLEKMYSDHSLIHQKMGTRTLSKNQFFSRLQQILKLDERSRDILLPHICFGKQ